MKKLMFGLVAAAAAGAMAIESANVVGYKTYALDLDNPDDYVHNIGVQFKNVNTADNSYTISTSIFGLDLEDGDVIFVFDPEYYGYTLYTYTEVTANTMGFTVMFADGSQGEPITDATYVVFPEGQGGLYMPTDSRTWTVTYNY